MVALAFDLDSKALQAAIGRMRGPAVGKIQIRALEKHMNDARKDAVTGFRSHGIGKHLFGGNDRGAWGLIKVSRPKISDNVASVVMSVKGLAALQETGGRTRPHVIKPKFAKMLAFGVAGGFGFGGDLVFAKVVNHPGGAMPRHEFMKAATQRVLVGAIEDIQRDTAALWDGKAA